MVISDTGRAIEDVDDERDEEVELSALRDCARSKVTK
jgi:hypothetical protein